MLGFIANKLMFPGVSAKPPEGCKESILYLEYPESDLVLLYSHGNAETIYLSRGYMRHLAWTLRVNVCCYEYPGYLDGKGSCVKDVNKAILEAYEWLVYIKEYEPSRIVLMGRSIGTGPTLWLASTNPRIKFGGIILQSPFTTIKEIGKDVLQSLVGCLSCPSIMLHSWVVGEMYDNVSSIKNVDERTPILFIHGKQDEVIPCFMTDILVAEASAHENHMVHIQNKSTHNSFDYPTMLLHMTHFIERIKE